MLKNCKEPLQLFCFVPADILSQLQGHFREDIVMSAAIAEKNIFRNISRSYCVLFILIAYSTLHCCQQVSLIVIKDRSF